MIVDEIIEILQKLNPESYIFVELGTDLKPYCVRIQSIRVGKEPNTSDGTDVVYIRAYEIQMNGLQYLSAKALDDAEYYKRKEPEEYDKVFQITDILKKAERSMKVMVQLGPDLSPYAVECTRVYEYDDVSLAHEDADYEDCKSVAIRAYEIPEKFIKTVPN
ncbi:hypothetical protein RBI07_36175 (plasmid) [Pseudomonas aeruginosa]|uniref:hypothetical protein n=1 Tax=Pseudomonas aeruginosa TaxID=287 RepID=UPI0027DCA2E7|nr:hypothetical protein [Pseudomonas aeruginosa]WMI79461.1 hypothetical protein RBI07_36175 [Pseudomonas aeruginosa]